VSFSVRGRGARGAGEGGEGRKKKRTFTGFRYGGRKKEGGSAIDLQARKEEKKTGRTLVRSRLEKESVNRSRHHRPEEKSRIGYRQGKKKRGGGQHPVVGGEKGLLLAAKFKKKNAAFSNARDCETRGGGRGGNCWNGGSKKKNCVPKKKKGGVPSTASEEAALSGEGVGGEKRSPSAVSEKRARLNDAGREGKGADFSSSTWEK